MLKASSRKLFVVSLVIIAAIIGYVLLAMPSKEIDFSTQVKPILNSKCIACHGGVKKQAGFSVLFREDMFAPTKSGRRAVVPGDPGASEMIRRVNLSDPEERMPYKHAPLSKDEINILTTWIKQGAKWGEHLAYKPVKNEPVPDVDGDWAKTDIDKFILQRLEEHEMSPSPEATKPELLRRVSLDLIGTQPSPSVAKAFLQSDNPNAYTILVDSLLASKEYGEKWTSMWLDLSRYADTKGYEADKGRNIWEYRDWVIRAFNKDMPYDRFLTEQMAGDLLPNPTDAQYIATGFHRNSMTNDEGGTDNEEFRTAAVLDRVNTTWTAVMSTSFGCVQCHSHPYDPIRHDEFYKFMAYFNNTRDEDVPGEYPLLRRYDDSLQAEVNAILTWVDKYGAKQDVKRTELFLRTWQPSIYAESADSMTNAVLGNKNSSMFFRNNAVARLDHVNLEKVSRLICNFQTSVASGTMRMHLDAPDGPVFSTWKPVNGPWKKVFVDFPQLSGIHDVYLTYTNPAVKDPEKYVVFFDWFAFQQKLPGEGEAGYAGIVKKYEMLVNTDVPTTPVIIENPEWMHRASYVFERGAWTNKTKKVEAAVPQTFQFAMPKEAPNNRLGLAMWMTDKRNPLVSRTIVNRIWEQLFGAGIVETLEDMGTQGSLPTHRELLDHLSYRLMTDYKWSLKKLIKEIVTSKTYKQSAKADAEKLKADPENKWVARASRLRLTAEQIRDQALAISGTLSDKMYGPGVMPWQPDGIWFSPYNSARWQNSEGEDQYRRAVYTYWKRSAPYPSSITFDSPQRNVCSARRISTNTPLQALAVLNDSAFIDLSKHFALRMQKEGGATPSKQIARGFELMLYKKIPPPVLTVLLNLYNESMAVYRKEPKGIAEMVGDDKALQTPETASMVVVANAMLNLDEVVTRN